MVLSTGTEDRGRRGDLGSRPRAYFELELTDIHKVIPDAGCEFSQNRRELAGDREVALFVAGVEKVLECVWRVGLLRDMDERERRRGMRMQTHRMAAGGRVSSDKLIRVTLSKQPKVLESSRSTGKGGPDFLGSVVSGAGGSSQAVVASLA